MPFGFTNTTNITMDNITYLANSSDFVEFLVKGNEVMFGGVGFFILLCVLLIILIMIYQEINEDEFLINLMVSSTVVSIGSLFFRAGEIYVYGVKKGLLTDKLLWIFPLIMIFSASILYMTKRR